MPTWGGIAQEINKLFPQQQMNTFDIIRRKYLADLSNYTKRNTIIYATNWTQPGKDPNTISISDEDIQGLMEVIHGLQYKSLDLILHSPGGSAESAAAMVSYIRSKFDDVRVIIPQAAMSAATMVSCSANEIVMGKHSSIGPIDPQFILQTPLGVMAVPAQAILDQFKMACNECKDPQKLGPWFPILSQYGPALLVQSQDAIDLAKKYASEWLLKYMFSKMEDRKQAEELATKISNNLSDHSRFKSHGHHINREEARELGLTIRNLEDDQKLQDLVLSVYHATTHTFNGTPAVKLIENQDGRAYVKLQAMQIPLQLQQQKPQPPSLFDRLIKRP